jgi:excisionase family DNA binding protein
MRKRVLENSSIPEVTVPEVTVPEVTAPTPSSGRRLEHLPDVLTIPECAKVLRLGRNTTYDLARMGKLPTIRLGRRLLVPKIGLVRLLSVGFVQSTE